MRSHGNLVRWNEERGFGFVRPAHRHEDIFVHISAFPRDGIRPSVGELVSFEIESGPDGRNRAVRVMRPGAQQVTTDRVRPVRTAARVPARRPGILQKLFNLALVFALGFAGIEAYQRFTDSHEPTSVNASSTPTRLAIPAPTPQFTCDGRQHCSQMGSYEEASFFLRNCPDTRMDGDNDGIPCEQQFGR